MPHINTVTNLSQHVGKDSSFLKLWNSTEFIDQPVEEWLTSESYKSDIERLKLLVCVNDVAERGAKLRLDLRLKRKTFKMSLKLFRE